LKLVALRPHGNQKNKELHPSTVIPAQAGNHDTLNLRHWIPDKSTREWRCGNFAGQQVCMCEAQRASIGFRIFILFPMIWPCCISSV